MTTIDPTARIEPGARIGEGVTIGPYCIVGANVAVGDGCRLLAHVYLTGHTVIGPRTVVYPFAALGTPPQAVAYRGGPTRLEIGADCVIRESVTMNTGTENGGGLTRVGDRCMFMTASHVGHDCLVGSDVTLANGTMLGGHVSVGDFTFFGGGSAVHQFARIGEGVMVSGLSGIAADVIPFGFVVGHRGRLGGLNVVGLKRRGHTRADMHRLRDAYRMLFSGEGAIPQRTAQVTARYTDDPVVGKIVAFIRASGTRPLMQPERLRGGESGADEI